MNSKTSKPVEANKLFAAVQDLLLWRNSRLTVVVFTTVMILLLDIMAHSVISVISMAGITILLAAVAYRCFRQFSKWRKNGAQDEVTRMYPQVRIDIPREEAMQLAGVAVDYLNKGLNRVIGLILVESWEDSLKCLAMLCGLNLLGDCFNGITLILFGHILLFTLPKLYEWYQPFIDDQLEKFSKFKKHDKKTPETKTENTENPPENNLAKVQYKEEESTESNMLYKVCDNEQLFDLLEEEHRKGCRCRDCEHQDLPIEAH
ncbi:hypothetical protein KR054_004021 [Drosophila jambulina]|nr:hypothetical protein KR054_004021 [Drosophila jambulina]